jgi:fibronectin-binding autotransporter adhesin
MPFHAMRRHLSRLARCLALLACHALLVATAAHAQKAIEKDASGNLTASYSVGNRTLTVASGGTLNAVAGSNIILAGTTTLSGNITSNATVTHSGALTVTGNSTLGNATLAGNLTLSGNNNTAAPNRTIDLGTGPSSDGYFYPLKWGSGSRYTLGGGYSTFQGVQDHLGNFAYNQVQTAGDVNFGLGFEARFQNAPQGTDTEHYYFWNGPIGVSADSGGRTNRRIWQINTSWGTGYNAPPIYPMGYTQIGYDVNKFYVDNGANYNGEFLIDFTSSPKRLTWQNAMTLGGALTIGGAITQTGTNTNTLSGATTITASNASYTFATGNNSLLTVANGIADNAIQLNRNTGATEYMRIGGAAGGTNFGGSSNAFHLDRVAASAGTIRNLVFRRSADSGSTFTHDLVLGPGRLRIGTGSDDAANALQVVGSAYIIGGNSNVRLDGDTLGAGNSGIWFADSGTATSTNYHLGGSGTDLLLNSPNGSTIFLNGNSTRATLSSTGIAFVATTEATTGGAGSITTAGGIYAAKAIVSASTTAASSTTTGSIITGGGIGVAGAAYIGGLLNAGGGAVNIAHTGNNPTLRFLQTSTETWSFQSFSSDLYLSGTVTGKSLFIRDGGSSPTLTFRPDTGIITFAGTTEATTGGAGQLVTAGGIYAAKKIVTSSDVEVADIGEGIIIKSPNGTRWRITVSNAGAFVATAL